jgi:branched-chain amino acid transport system permease protein
VLGALVLTVLLALAARPAAVRAAAGRGSDVIIIVMASFGASMALRSLLEFIFTAQTGLFHPANCRSRCRSASACGRRRTSSW